MLKYHAEATRCAAGVRARRVGLIAIPSGATLLVAAFLLPSSCAGSFVREVSVNVLAEAIAPQVTRTLGALGGLRLTSQDAEATRVTHQVGLELAEELARDHHYWCGREESEKVCSDRIAPMAAEDLVVVLQRWDESIHKCRQAAIENPALQQSGELQIIDEIFVCMEKLGYQRQIATLRRESGAQLVSDESRRAASR